jgi:hypothetical protein
VLRGGSRPYRVPLGGGANKLRGSNQKRLIMLKVAPSSSRRFERGSLTRTTRMLPQRDSRRISRQAAPATMSTFLQARCISRKIRLYRLALDASAKP